MAADGPHWIWDGWNFRPVTATGWKQLAAWTAPFVLGLLIVLFLAVARPDAALFPAIIFLVGTPIWTVALIRWCKQQV